MSSDQMVWYKSKVDWWLAGVLIALPLLQIALLLSAALSGDQNGITAGAIGLAIIAGVLFLLVLPIKYGITEDALLVHFGIVRQTIPYHEICELRLSRMPWSSPALSLDRIAVKTGRGPFYLTLISPKDREEFMRMLAEKADLMPSGERWVARGDS